MLVLGQVLGLIFYVQGDVGLYMQNTFRHEKQQGDVGSNRKRYHFFKVLVQIPYSQHITGGHSIES